MASFATSLIRSQVGCSLRGSTLMYAESSRSIVIPDRLPSLIVLVGFWIPPAVAGWVAAASLYRGTKRSRATVIFAVLAIFVLLYAGAWFLFNLGRMPPYIPGASTDPTYAPPQAVRGLAVVASALVLPGSAIACVLAFRNRARRLRRTSAARVSN